MRQRVRPSATPGTPRRWCLCERYVPAVQRLRGWQNSRTRSTTVGKYPSAQATLRRYATMAGISAARSRPHSFYQGRDDGGVNGGWKFQIASARRIRSSRSCAAAHARPWQPSPATSGRDTPADDLSRAGGHNQPHTPPGRRRPAPSPQPCNAPRNVYGGNSARLLSRRRPTEPSAFTIAPRAEHQTQQPPQSALRPDRISATNLNHYVEQTGIESLTKNDRSSFLTTMHP